MKTTKTYKYFEELSQIVPQNDYEKYLQNLGKEVLKNIKSVNDSRGYVVLQDDTIKCTNYASMYVITYDGCTEKEMEQGIAELIRGY